jgi:hypothetical protein
MSQLIDLIPPPAQPASGFLHCHHYYVAISHYRKKDGSWERSFVQHYFDTPATSHQHQWENGHARIDALKNLLPGEYREEMHSLEKSHPHLLAHRYQHIVWAKYHVYGPPPTTQTTDAITTEPLSETDVYIPHVGDANPTAHYQAVLQTARPGATIEDCTFATNSYENAIELSHRILDEILHPYHLAWHERN